jgi:hypothetical protein
MLLIELYKQFRPFGGSAVELPVSLTGKGITPGDLGKSREKSVYSCRSTNIKATVRR